LTIGYVDRKEGALALLPFLTDYKGQKDVIVIGLARGGVVTASLVARELKLPLDLLCLRKIGAPHHPELAIGAISKTGDVYLNQDLIDQMGVQDEYLKAEMQKQQFLAKRRESLYHEKLPPEILENKTVILVDDGLATGATMKAAIQFVKSQGASKVIVAVPVGADDSLHEVSELADDVVCPLIPPFFQAVGQFYEEFDQVEDEEVIQILNKVKNEK
jgi:putative phosphoribosyl transferase